MRQICAPYWRLFPLAVNSTLETITIFLLIQYTEIMQTTTGQSSHITLTDISNSSLRVHAGADITDYSNVHMCVSLTINLR